MIEINKCYALTQNQQNINFFYPFFKHINHKTPTFAINKHSRATIVLS